MQRYTMSDYLAIDIHVHVQPFEMINADAKKAFGAHLDNPGEVMQTVADPAKFLRYLDRVGVEKAGLINYVAPESMGWTSEVNEWVARYARHAPQRLIPFGSVHPRLCDDPAREVERLAKMGIRALKVHPPHQWLYPNEYRTDLPQQAKMYERAQALGIPVMFHTGTSIFPRARNIYGDPIYLDDLIVDFPHLKIIMAHGGRPLWMDTAFFLMRRSPNVYLDISGIPPQHLLQYFPRLEAIADHTMFGSDYPGPIVKDIGANLDKVRALPLSDDAKRKILCDTALKVFG
jgi:predicted TIM-barrel fold metal-dependent hydrolase